MTILICQFGNETNTFAPGRTELSDLSPGGWIPGNRVEAQFGGTRSFLGGALDAIRELGHTPMPIDLLSNNGNFGAGPLMSAACAREAVDHICAQTAERRNDRLPGRRLVGVADAVVGHFIRHRHVGMENVRMCGAEKRNRTGGLRPGRRMRGMRMHNAADGRERLVERKVRGRVA